MTPDHFTSLVQDLAPKAQARIVFATTQFKVGGKTFATLGWPQADLAVVKLDPGQQAWALGLSSALSLEPGPRRRAGVIVLRLAAVEPEVCAQVLAAAWRFATREPARRGKALVRELGARVAA